MPHLAIADRVGRRAFRRFGPYVSWMDRDDWIQEARIALLRVLRRQGEIAVHAMPEAKLAYAIRAQLYSYTVTPLFRRKRPSRSTREEALRSVHAQHAAEDATFHLWEVAYDVQACLAHARPDERTVLMATLADRFVGRGTRTDPETARFTRADFQCHRRFVRRQQTRLGLTRRTRCATDAPSVNTRA